MSSRHNTKSQKDTRRFVHMIIEPVHIRHFAADLVKHDRVEKKLFNFAK